MILGALLLGLGIAAYAEHQWAAAIVCAIFAVACAIATIKEFP